MFVYSPKALAILVQNERKKLKLSQAEVAKLVGLKQATISAFENKPESTKLETVFRILAAINLEIGISKKNKQELTKAEWNEEW